jgi:3-hydroxy acid dehydrogenase/malonic semialdehyde reductase
VNNAGYVEGMAHVGEIDDSVIRGMFATNVIGLIDMTQQVMIRKITMLLRH